MQYFFLGGSVLSSVYINKGKIICAETGKEYEQVKMMDIGEDHHGSLFWNPDLEKWCRWKPAV